MRRFLLRLDSALGWPKNMRQPKSLSGLVECSTDRSFPGASIIFQDRSSASSTVVLLCRPLGTVTLVWPSQLVHTAGCSQVCLVDKLACLLLLVFSWVAFRHTSPLWTLLPLQRGGGGHRRSRWVSNGEKIECLVRCSARNTINRDLGERIQGASLRWL